MKKFTLSLLAACAITGSAFGQAVTTIEAPQYDGSYSSLSVPSGSSSSVYHRTCWLVLQSELSGLALTNSVITNFGLEFIQGVNAATSGNFTVYLQNTTDVTYNKGTNWNTLLTGMSMNYTGSIALPVTTGYGTSTVNLTNTFNYTGGGIYVAMDWYAPSAAASQLAFGYCNTTGPGLSTTGGARATAPSAGPAPTTLSTSAFRPAFLWSAANTATNEASIVGFQPLGQVSKLEGLTQNITAQVRNNSSVAMNNVSVALAISGANTYAGTATITIPSGSVGTVTFAPGFNAVNAGANNMTVSLLPDQDNSNNSATWTQSVTCGELAVTPAAPAGQFTSSAYGMGSSGGILAFKYTTGTNPSTLVSVNCVVPSFTNAGNAGNSLYPVLCDASGAILAQGNPIVLSASNMDVLFPFTFNTPYALTGNTTYYFGVASTTTNYPVGTINTNNTIFNHYRIPLAGGAPTQSSLDYLSLTASVVFNAINLTSTATKTNVCKADKYTLTVSGANTYTWNTNVTTTTISTNFTAAGVIPYSVVGTGTNGCKSNKAIITFSVSNCTGLDNNEAYGAEIKSFPNPTVDGKVTIAGLEGTNTITVYNVLGQVISNSTSSNSSVEVDLSNEAAGNYMIKVANGDAFKMIKVISKN